MMEGDPETVAATAWNAMKEGRDIRAITAILDRAYGDDTGYVEDPYTFDELARLSRDDRRTLLRQLEHAGRAQPFVADDFRAQLARGEAEQRAELAKLSREERRILSEHIAALNAEQAANPS